MNTGGGENNCLRSLKCIGLCHWVAIICFDRIWHEIVMNRLTTMIDSTHRQKWDRKQICTCFFTKLGRGLLKYMWGNVRNSTLKGWFVSKAVNIGFVSLQPVHNTLAGNRSQIKLYFFGTFVIVYAAYQRILLMNAHRVRLLSNNRTECRNLRWSLQLIANE